MRTIAFLALFALTASAFNLTEYHLGVASQNGFNTNETDEGIVCLNALSADFSEISALLQTESFEDITTEFGQDLVQLQTDIHTTCLPYFNVLGTYVYESTGGKYGQNLTETIQANFKQYFTQIIQQVGLWVGYLQQGNDFEAGVTQSYIGQILNGVEIPSVITVANATTIVPFNTSKFFDEYFTTIFQTLGIDAPINVSALVQCQYLINNVSGTIAYTKTQWANYTFDQKLDVVQYIFSLGFAAVRGCEGAGVVAGNILVPQYEAFESDPVGFTLEVVERIAADLPEYIASIQQEIVDIQEGDYVAAGQEKVNRINNDFGGLVNYTISA